MKTLSATVADLSATVTSTSDKVAVLLAKQQNSAAARTAKLVGVSCENGRMPDGDFPTTIMELLVAGNEKLPDGSQNIWNSKKSKKLLAQYGDESYGAQSDVGEYTMTSRVRRLKVARRMGVTQAELNFAQLSL
ncbi:hypothetical protein GPECTOR_23g126 [Gonium pectorale]|uniref:Uncharacterized protein n=1 Tax=Gonium pectorale TaxID=33097 RepID=A0A150GGY1_GONPE|nr:hypothetical protein GPECTOR_23g126 [Gonium pectorale]|eukprot:KXZ49039.1 hypothetical protein GPECTOR_23g126 [Gonium pectorale]